VREHEQRASRRRHQRRPSDTSHSLRCFTRRIPAGASCRSAPMPATGRAHRVHLRLEHTRLELLPCGDSHPKREKRSRSDSNRGVMRRQQPATSNRGDPHHSQRHRGHCDRQAHCGRRSDAQARPARRDLNGADEPVANDEYADCGQAAVRRSVCAALSLSAKIRRDSVTEPSRCSGPLGVKLPLGVALRESLGATPHHCARTSPLWLTQ